MDLIKKYIYAVGKRLAKKQRLDIERELESSIFDTLEDKFGKNDESWILGNTDSSINSKFSIFR